MWFVYIIQHNETKQFYIGVTGDIKRRMQEHNNHQQAATKRKSGTWQLIYAELYRVKEDAYQREYRLKNHGRAKQELIKRIAKSKLN